jgi:hypothetical protein
MRLIGVASTDHKLFAFVVRMSLLGATLFEASRDFSRGESTLITGPNPRQICSLFEEETR